MRHKDSWFAFYDRKTDELICCGGYDFCIKQLGISESSFRKVLSRARHGKSNMTVYVNEIELYDPEDDLSCMNESQKS